MLFAGIDIGSRSAKAVIMKDDAILSSAICDTGPESIKTSYKVIERALNSAGLSLDDVDYTVATGYGRVLVPFANENISEISCHARGINWYFPSVRTILDMGGQDCKAISCDGNGKVTNFVMNDKCAGGTGRFFEMIAEVLNVPLTEIGDLSLKAKTVTPFNTICAVFAKSEAIAYLKKGTPKSNILAGLHRAVAARSFDLLKRVSLEKDFSITGGIAKNRGMVAKLTEMTGLEPLLCEDPQIIGALGASLFARERFQGGKLENTKVQYGYTDGTGNYFITIDTGKCNGCGKCVQVCPVEIFVLAEDTNGQHKAVIKETARKQLALLCPGLQSCNENHEANCHTVCSEEAISHSW